MKNYNRFFVLLIVLALALSGCGIPDTGFSSAAPREEHTVSSAAETEEKTEEARSSAEETSHAEGETSEDPTEKEETDPPEEALTVAFSAASGFYDEVFDLSITTNKPAVIHYTLNGNIPTEKSVVYRAPIRIYDRSIDANTMHNERKVNADWPSVDYVVHYKLKKCFVVRAYAVTEDGEQSPVITASYFVGQDALKEQNVISLTTDYANLFNPYSGIYVTGVAYDNWYYGGCIGEKPLTNYKQTGKEWEREANFDYFEAGTEVLSQDVGIRIQGHTARNYIPRRFSVYARKEYAGSKYFDTNLISEDHRTHAVVLREGLENSLCQEIMSGRDLGVTQSKKVVLFIDGEYWADYYMQEKYSEEYIQEAYGGDDDFIKAIKVGSTYYGDREPLEEAGYYDIYAFLKEHDLSKDENMALFEEMVDVQSYIDFMCANVILANLDYDEDKNYFVWRSGINDGTFYGDNRWRFGLYDMDLLTWEMYCQLPPGSGITKDYAFDAFSVQPRWCNCPLREMPLFKALRKNKAFRDRFVRSFMDILNTNLSRDHVEEVFLKYGLDPDTYRDGFYVRRAPFAEKNLKQEFRLSKTAALTLHVNDEAGGKIRLNTITPELKEDCSWTGTYFTDVPVILEAVPAEGYCFVEWKTPERTVLTSRIEYPLLKDTEITAVFKKVE